MAAGALWILTSEGLSVCFTFNFEEYFENVSKSLSCLLLLLLLLLLVELGDVEALVDVPGDGLDLCAQLRLDPVERESVIIGDQVDGHSEMAVSAASPDPVQVSLGHLGEVEVDDHVDGLDVDTAGEEVTADKVPAQAGAEVVEHSVTMSLENKLLITYCLSAFSS